MIASIFTKQCYFDNPLCLEFNAEVNEIIPLSGGRIGAILPATYYYPTSGGQEHDTGTIDDAIVLDVFVDEDGRIIHVLDRPIIPGQYPARIDQERRMRAMQHHTAQHILSGTFDHLLDLGTVSANINGYTPSTIDLSCSNVSVRDLQRVEEFANGIVFNNRVVKSYFVSDKEIGEVPFRRPPKVSGTIRVIEVDGFDYSACGGTHCPQTGMVGLIKIIRTERVNQKLRIHFVAGQQALDVFRDYQMAVQDAGVQLDVRPERVGEAVREQQGRMRQIQSEIDLLRLEQMDMKAEQLAKTAIEINGIHLVTALFRDLATNELRLLGSRLGEKEDVVAVLGAYDGQKLSLMAACAAGTGIDARDLLRKHLAPINGRGGGDASLAQGGGTCSETFLSELFANTQKHLEENGS